MLCFTCAGFYRLIEGQHDSYFDSDQIEGESNAKACRGERGSPEKTKSHESKPQ
jgi:hypothetical protein